MQKEDKQARKQIIQIDRKTEIQRDRETERQRDRETERQRDRETERQRDRNHRNRDRQVNISGVLRGLSKLYKIRIKLRFSMGKGVSSYRTMFASIIICYVILFCNTFILFSIEVDKITYASLRYLAANFFLYFHPSLTTF